MKNGLKADENLGKFYFSLNFTSKSDMLIWRESSLLETRCWNNWVGTRVWRLEYSSPIPVNYPSMAPSLPGEQTATEGDSNISLDDV